MGCKDTTDWTWTNLVQKWEGKNHTLCSTEMKERDIWCSTRQDPQSGYCRSHDITGDAGVEVQLSSMVLAIH